MQVKKQLLELDMEQQNGFKLRKEYVKDACCHPAYLTCMQIKKQRLKPDREQRTGSKLRKECIKAACCNSAYLT